MSGTRASINDDARFIPSPTIKSVAPNASIPGIAAFNAPPNSPITATRPATTTPNAAMAIAPSVPVLAIGVMASASTDIEAEKAITPAMLVDSDFPNTPNVTASPATTTPNAASAGTAVDPNSPSGTSARARADNESVMIAMPADAFRKELPSTVICFGVDLMLASKYVIPKERPVTASAIPEKIAIAGPPASASSCAAFART